MPPAIYKTASGDAGFQTTLWMVNVGSWIIVDTQTAPANGLFSYMDPSPPLPIAFYRLQQSSTEGERLDAVQSVISVR